MTAKKEVRKRQASDIADAAAPPSKKKAAKTKQAGASKDAPVAASTSTSTAATQDFPRGGGTGMTPIEYRSVVKQAERDLFGENATASNGAPAKTKSKTKKPLTDEEYKDRKRKQRERRNVKKHKQAPLPASDKTNDDAEHDADDYTGPHHVTGLTFKRLATGTLLLGMISKISDLHLTVALPNNLTGRVAITEISTEITRRAEAAAEDEDDDEEDVVMDDADNDDVMAEASSRGLPDLHAMFHIGQWVRCAVVGLEAGDDAQSTSNGTAKKSRKRIDLSLRVDQVNAGVVPIDLIPGFTLSATVTSLEDHGYLLDIGIADRTAFLPRKEAEAYTRQWHAGRPLQAGQPIIVTVMESSKKKAAAAQRVVHVTADPERTRQASVREALSNVQSLLPGEQVMARITRVLSNGLACRVLEFFDATIDIAHIPGMATIKQSGDHALRGQFKVGDKITARILYVSLSLAHKSIALTLLPHALSLERPGTATSTALGPDYGMVVDKAVVRRVENGVGLWCTMESMPDVPAFVHISRVADRHVQNLNASTWSPGTAHQARVVGFDPVDNVVQLSLQESVLSCPYLRIEDLPLGGKVKVTMKKLTAQGMVVDITDTPLSGFVPLVHLADVTLMKPEKKFKYGDHLVARVLATNPTDHKVFLTLKRSLVQSDLPVLTSYADATVGAFVQGYVTAVKPFGCMIGFYNSVRALCPLRELSETTLDNPQQHFQVGQPVRCRILSVDPAHERLRVSLRTHATIVQPEQWAAIELGQLVKARVVECGVDVIWLALVDSNIRAALPLAHLSDHATAAYLQRLHATFHVDRTIDDLVVIAKQEARGHLLVSHKPLLVEAARARTTPYTFDAIQEGDVLPGYISNIAEHDVFVSVLGGQSARVAKSQLSDQFVASIADHFTHQQSVLGLVTRVDREQRRIDMSLKRSVVEPTAEQSRLFLASYFAAQPHGDDPIAAIRPGQWIDGVIEQQQSYGWIVQLAQGLSGFITLDQCQEVSHQVSDSIRARILDVDYERKIVDLSLKPVLVNATPADEQASKSKKNKKGKKQAKDAAAAASVDSMLSGEQSAIIELVKEDYLVVSLPQSQHRIAFAATKTYNQREKPFMRYRVGQQLTVQPCESSTAARALVLIMPAAVLNENINKANTTHLATIGGIDLSTRKIQSPLDTSLSIMGDIQPGRRTQARIQAIKDAQINVQLADNLKGRIHITELFDRYEDIADPARPMAAFKLGQVLDNLTVIGWHKIRSHKQLAISHRDAVASEAVNLSRRTPSSSSAAAAAAGDAMSNKRVGDTMIGFVRRVKADHLTVCVAAEPAKDMRIEAMAVTREPTMASDLQKHFKPGMALAVRVLEIHPTKKRLTLGVVSGTHPPILSFDDVKVNDVVVGQIHTVNAEHGLVVHLGRSVFGRVGLCDLFDTYKENPTASFEKAQYVACAVVAIDQAKKHVALSLRASDTRKAADGPQPTIAHPVISSAKDVAPGDLVSGYVRRLTEKGCFVTLGRGQFDAMVQIKDMSDKYVKDWKTLVKVGQLVQGRVLNVNELTNHVQISLKASSVAGKTQRVLGDFTKGEKVKATIKKIETFGMFLAIDDTSVSGLCHISEVSDTRIDDLQQVYTVGDRVKAIVLDIDEAKKRISFGLKASYFEDEDMVSESDDDEEDSESDEEAEDEEDEDAVMKDAASSASEASESEDESMAEEEEVTAAAPSLELSGFSWETANAAEAEIGLSTLALASDSDDDDNEQASKKTKKAKKAGIDWSATKDVTAELAESAPTTAADYERLLVGSPNSSYLWINFMAFQLQMSEIERAREIAERALKTIHFREGQERANVWLAWLNLENKYGTAESLDATFQKALQANDPKHITLQLVNIYEQSDKLELAETLYKTMTKKFSTSAKVWTRFGLYYLQHGNIDASRQLLQRSLLSLPKRKHIKVISRFAQMEFKHGEPERGRTIFEGIMSNYPKRLDLWSVYLDMEIRTKDEAITRRLFQRVISLKFSSKKMKFLFKKWLQWEQSIGSEEGEAEVKRQALAYVQSA